MLPTLPPFRSRCDEDFDQLIQPFKGLMSKVFFRLTDAKA